MVRGPFFASTFSANSGHRQIYWVPFFDHKGTASCGGKCRTKWESAKSMKRAKPGESSDKCTSFVGLCRHDARNLSNEVGL